MQAVVVTLFGMKLGAVDIASGYYRVEVNPVVTSGNDVLCVCAGHTVRVSKIISSLGINADKQRIVAPKFKGIPSDVRDSQV